MRNPVDRNAIAKASADLRGIEAFGVLGRKVEALPERFVFYLVPNWPTPSFSPLLLLPGSDLGEQDLTQLEQLYSTVRVANATVKDTPYFTFIKQDGLYDVPRLDAALTSADWYKEDKPLLVKIFTDAPDCSLPEGHTTEVTEFSRTGFPAAYLDLLRDGFAADDAYVSHMERTFSGSNARTRIVLIRNPEGTVVAGGAASVRERMGFLTWGTVARTRRNNGYHRYILNHCLAAGASAGARMSALTTRNEHVSGRCDLLLELYICRKRGTMSGHDR
jgi:hypothetical protein